MRTNVITVPPTMDQEDVARRMAKYDLNVMPVVDDDGVLLGVITIDDIIDVLVQEQTEDVQKIGAVEPLDVPYFQTTLPRRSSRSAPAGSSSSSSRSSSRRRRCATTTRSWRP